MRQLDISEVNLASGRVGGEWVNVFARDHDTGGFLHDHVNNPAVRRF